MQQAEWENHTDLTLVVKTEVCVDGKCSEEMLSEATRRTCLLPHKNKPRNRATVSISLQKSCLKMQLRCYAEFLLEDTGLNSKQAKGEKKRKNSLKDESHNRTVK